MTQDKRYDKDLVSVLAHDLRTPINSVRGFIEVAMFSGEMNERQRGMLEKAMMALERMDTLINDVLDMSRADSDAPLKLEPCDMRLLVLEAVSLLEGAAAAKDMQVHVDIPENLPELQAEPHRIKQMVNNLLGNGLKYNGKGGEVWTSVAIDGEMMVFTVRDNGYGIPEEDLPNIFDRFYRSDMGRDKRISGSGLGLAIVKAIVERHDGAITVESVTDEGTQFTVRLPLNPAQASS